MRSLSAKLEPMLVSHDAGGKVRRSLAADVKGYALFGGTRKEYRYFLRRVWNEKLPATMFVMMNPSIADIDADDPTVARCQTFARSAMQFCRRNAGHSSNKAWRQNH